MIINSYPPRPTSDKPRWARAHLQVQDNRCDTESCNDADGVPNLLHVGCERCGRNDWKEILEHNAQGAAKQLEQMLPKGYSVTTPWNSDRHPFGSLVYIIQRGDTEVTVLGISNIPPYTVWSCEEIYSRLLQAAAAQVTKAQELLNRPDVRRAQGIVQLFTHDPGPVRIMSQELWDKTAWQTQED